MNIAALDRRIMPHADSWQLVGRHYCSCLAMIPQQEHVPAWREDRCRKVFA